MQKQEVGWLSKEVAQKKKTHYNSVLFKDVAKLFEIAYFKTQAQIKANQLWWVDTLVLMNVDLIYKLRYEI